MFVAWAGWFMVDPILRPSIRSNPKVQIPIGKIMRWIRWNAAAPFAFLVVLCIGFNAIRFSSGIKGDCFVPLNDGTRCYSFAIGPVRLHLHNYSIRTGWEDGDYSEQSPITKILCHAPILGVGPADSDAPERGNSYERRIIVLPLLGILMLIGFAAFWRRLATRHPEKANAIVGKLLPEVSSARVLTFRFGFTHLGLGEKIILGSTLAALFSLFMPWVAMGIISSSGRNQQGYLFLLLFIYPVIAVFNVKGLNKKAGIICGALALGVTIWYISDKRYNDDYLGKGNFSASGLYLFAASTIGLIIGAVKCKRNS